MPWEGRYAIGYGASLPKKEAAEGKVRRIDPEGLTKATKSFGPMASSPESLEGEEAEELTHGGQLCYTVPVNFSLKE